MRLFLLKLLYTLPVIVEAFPMGIAVTGMALPDFKDMVRLINSTKQTVAIVLILKPLKKEIVTPKGYTVKCAEQLDEHYAITTS